MRRALALLAFVISLAGCSTMIPQPFAHPQAAPPNPLLSDARVLSTMRVLPVPGLPGLDVAMTQALADQDILASTTASLDGSIVLAGLVDRGVLTWTLTDADRKPIGRVRQPLPGGAMDPGGVMDKEARLRFAAEGAVQVSRALRGRELGLDDIQAAPVVAMLPVQAPQNVDGRALQAAMHEALAQQGLRLIDGPPTVMVGARIALTRGQGDQDLMAINWTVTDPNGHELGSMSQASPVSHVQVTGAFSAMARDIADAGAPGLAGLIRKATADKAGADNAGANGAGGG